jgi:hypothetical protein
MQTNGTNKNIPHRSSRMPKQTTSNTINRQPIGAQTKEPISLAKVEENPLKLSAMGTQNN